MKKKLTIALSLLVVVAIAVGGTLAYFSVSTEEVENVFTVGKNIKLTLHDVFPDDPEPATPGAEIEKKVGVENSGTDTPLYAAIAVKFAAKSAVYYQTAAGEDWLAWKTTSKDDTDGTLNGGYTGPQKLQRYENIISPIEYDNAMLDDGTTTITQADYLLIPIDSSFYGFYVKKTAIEYNYWKDGNPADDTDYDERTMTIDTGDPVWSDDNDNYPYEEYTIDPSLGLMAFKNFAFLSYGKTEETTPQSTLKINPEWTYVGMNADGYNIFIRNEELAAGAATSYLFDHVCIDKQADANTLAPFSITVQGYATQTAGFDNAQSALGDAFPTLLAGITP